MSAYEAKKQSKAARIFKNIGEGIIRIPKEHIGFRKQIFMLAKQDLIKTYKGAVIGPFWALMKPLFQLFVYWFAFTIGMNGNSNRVATELKIPFFVFIMVGFLPWCFMSDCVSRGSKCLRDNRQFVNKISFPVSAIMTYTTISKFYIHLMLFSFAYAYLVIAGFMPSIYNFQIFGYAALMFIFYLALTWSLAPMSAFSKDFESFIATIMSGLFWLSGVCFDSYTIKNDFIKKLLLFNPMTFFINGYRKALIYDQWFYEGFYHADYENLIFLCEFIFVLVLGIFNYNRLRKDLPDVL
ncbi:MAG: ABC transporter permease [Clostridia bacterium]|nr:ABC transporter permease [Clostridia bacterium]